MLASLLIPTRKRPASLIAAIESFLKSADDVSRVEVLVRADLDDTETLTVLPTLPSQVCSIVGERAGYSGLHHMYNELYAISTGRFLWILNDDTLSGSSGWDTYLAQLPDVPCILHPAHNSFGGNLFPIISRIVPDTMGFFALYPAVDIQYEDITHLTGLSTPAPTLRIEHVPSPAIDIIDETGNRFGGPMEAERLRQGVTKLLEYNATHQQ